MKKENAFTLIELLAVIVILAIIALISTPIIIGVIEKARMKAFEDSAYGILDAGRVYFIDKLADQNKFEGATFTFPDGGDLKVSGEKPAGGTLFLDTEGKQELAIWDTDKKWCAYKTLNEEKITMKDYKEEDCKIMARGSTTIVDKNVSGNTEGLFTDDFGNVRYRGSNPKNYVAFNNEVWRIIGVFEGKIKLIRDDIVPNSIDGSNGFKWDTTSDWSVSFLQQYLNRTYHDSMGPISQSMIETTRYHLGGIASVFLLKKESYELERGTTVYAGRPTDWIGKIGLMYLSDYGYAVSDECKQTLYTYNDITCKNNNWLYKSAYEQWTITSYSTGPSSVALIRMGGEAYGMYSDYSYSVRPALYLKPTVKIISGDGTSANPYQLSL